MLHASTKHYSFSKVTRRMTVGLTIVAGSIICAPSAYADYIVNGDFNQTAINGSWAAIANGGVPGWTNTLNNDGIEIDNTQQALGFAPYAGTTFNAEVNGSTWDAITQEVTGLVAGDLYTVSWAYGDRPGSGPQSMNVYWGSSLVDNANDLIATDTDPGTSTGSWSYNSFTVLATQSDMYLTFAGESSTGLPSYGNEITAVSLVSTSQNENGTVPEPSSLALMGLAGVCLLTTRRKIK